MKRKRTPAVIGTMNPNFRRLDERQILGRVRESRPVLISRDLGTWESAAKKVFGIAGKSSAARVGTINLQRLRGRGRKAEVHMRSFSKSGGTISEKPGSFRKLPVI